MAASVGRNSCDENLDRSGRCLAGAAEQSVRSHQRPRNGGQNGGRYGQRQRESGAEPAPAAGELQKATA